MHAPTGVSWSDAGGGLAAEERFYDGYVWSLNPFPRVGEAIDHLARELDELPVSQGSWTHLEHKTNVYLLACGILNCMDEFLRGPALRIPSRFATKTIARAATYALAGMAARPRLRFRTRRWRDRFYGSLTDFLSAALSNDESEALRSASRELRCLLNVPLPAQLLRYRLGIPTAYSRIDLTHHDCLKLGDRFEERFPERTPPLLCVGVRTSGSYFAPMLEAYLKAKGYKNVHALTIEPNKGAGIGELRRLRHFARRDFCALVLDDPPHTSRTILAALDAMNRAGFGPKRIKILAASHPANPSWPSAFPEECVVTIDPEKWHKNALLQPENVERRLSGYFRDRGFASICLVASRRCQDMNAALEWRDDDPRSARLKRIFEVRATLPDGTERTKYVLAKSVGWGWFGYRAFLIGRRIKEFVPTIIGLRDGILYTEWIPEAERSPVESRSKIVGAAASYISARVRSLKIGDAGTGPLDLGRYNNGTKLLERMFSRAYGPVPVDLLTQQKLGRQIRQAFGGPPTLIDADMRLSQWIAARDGIVKTGFEHHGMGKAGLNVTDPAYDLADTILSLELSSGEERELIGRYIEATGDRLVGQRRLFINKLLAGFWRMKEAQEQMFSSGPGARGQQESHQRFMAAWNFLIVQSARHCGMLCGSSERQQWRPPIVFLDVDGVLDRRTFGFPCTTAAGITAISLLHDSGVSVALNTARPSTEVKSYCEAYSLAGGVAEHGAWIYDAVNERERVLIADESRRQLNLIRERLREIPGVFLDDRHQYSIRAFTYRERPVGFINRIADSARFSPVGDGAVAPISTHIVRQLLAELSLDRLCFHHTSIDTVVAAAETNKGRGLTALRDWVLSPDAETIAMGDGEADLPMFKVANRSFAPRNCRCRHQAALHGCEMSTLRNQEALLEVVERITEKTRDGHAATVGIHDRSFDEDLFMSVLRAADQRPLRALLRSLFERETYSAFIR